MALFINNHEITEIHVGKKIITTIHHAGKIIWEYIKSCFGRGFWVNEKPWINKDAWKN